MDLSGAISGYVGTYLRFAVLSHFINSLEVEDRAS